jgi:glycosyltransferase involved in cell wall biosynthesis
LGVEDPPEFTADMVLAFEQTAGFALKDFLLFMGRIDVKKGVELLVAAYNKLCAKQKILPKLVIAGPGLDTDYGRKIVALAESNENIVFPGMLTGHSKWGAFYSCNAFVLPSHQENFGIAVVEAMACGKAVLISDQVNIWEEIVGGKGGVAESDDEKGTNKMLESWLSKLRPEQLVMGKSARQIYLEKFTVKIAAKRLFEAIK